MAVKEKILLSFFLIAVFINFLGPIVDPDFPFHLKTGEYIYQHREIPQDDPFSFYGEGVITEREKFTLSQYWIAQIIFYKLYSLQGPTGIILLRAIIFSAFIFLLWIVLRKKGFYSSLIIAFLMTIMLQSYKVDRPQFFSFLFMVILILLLERFRESPHSKISLFFIPPLMLLWANMHAGFVFGIAVISIYALSEGFKLVINKSGFGCPLEKKHALLLFVVAFMSILFSYLNPDFNGQLLATLESHTDAGWLYKDNREYISPVKEMSVHFGNRVSASIFFIIFGFISIVTVLNAIRKKSVDITALFLIIFSSIAAFTAVRYIPFFVAVALPLSKNYRFFADTDFLRKFRSSAIPFVALLIFFVFAIVFGLRDYKGKFSIDKSHYPEGVANFLSSNHIEANIFNQFNKGSYLLWKLYPDYKVFNDTRFISLEAVIDTDAIAYTLQDYKQPLNLGLANALSALVPEELGTIKVSDKEYKYKPLWEKLLEQHNINLIVHEACSQFTKELYPITLRLLKDDKWALIYLDGKMLIFVRNIEKYSAIVKKFRLPKDLIYDEIILETVPLVSKKVPISTPYSSLAFAYMMKGNYESAKIMIDAALSLDKNDLVANFCEAYLALIRKAQENSVHKGK